MSMDSVQSSSGLTKFPHTRACLSALAREYGSSIKGETVKPPSDTSDSETDNDNREADPARTDDLVAQVIQLLDDDNEDGVKSLLKRSFDISDENVSVHSLAPGIFTNSPDHCRFWSRVCSSSCTSVAMIKQM